MSEGVYKKEWSDKSVWMKRFWCLALPPEDNPPDWFAHRCLAIKKKYSKEILDQWDMDAVKDFLYVDSEDEEDKEIEA